MLLILPPSETKSSGGSFDPLDLAALSFPPLNTRRRSLISAVRHLANDPESAMKALGLGPKLRSEVERNRTLSSSPTMPALERYTGVLFDALNAGEFTDKQREFAAAHVMVHSALFGLVGAGDRIPAYRLSHDSRISEHPLKKHWAGAIQEVLDGSGELILDLRSEAYVALGPAPAERSMFLRVVSEGSDGRRRALNHFNKKGKGEFVRSFIMSGQSFESFKELVDWAESLDIRLASGAPGELELVVDPVVAGAKPAGA